MKNKLLFLKVLIIMALMFGFANLVTVNADENASFYIKANGSVLNSQNATISASPGSEVSFELGVNTSKCVVSNKSGTGWRLNNVTLSNADSDFRNFIYTEGTNPSPRISVASSTPICATSDSKLKIATFTVSVPSDFNSSSSASIVFDDSTFSTENAEGGNRQPLAVSGITLNITYKAPSIDDKFSIKETTSSSVTIEVQKVTGTTCSLLRSTSENGTYNAISASVSCSGGEIVDMAGLSADTTYYYKLKVDDRTSAAKSAKTKSSGSVDPGSGNDPSQGSGSSGGSGSGSGSGSDNGDINGDTDTGAMTPIAVVGLCGVAFIVIRRYNKDNKLFNRI